MNSEQRSGTAQQAAEWFTPWRFGVMLAVFLFACFPRVLLGLDSFFFRDYGVLSYPFMRYAHDSFWRGELPLWNPLSNCGAPFLAQWGTTVLYPFSLIYLLLPMPWSLSFFCFAHLVLAGVGMHRLAERWTGNCLAASVAGVAFVFNGFTFSCLIWPNYTVALGWMPWVVLLTQQAWRQGRGRVLLAALASAMQMLSGVPELVMLTWLVVGALWIVEMITKSELKTEESAFKPGRGTIFFRLLMVVVLTAGFSAAQLLPFLDLLAHSQREHGMMTTKWAMAFWGWANLLVPLFHCHETTLGQFFQAGQEFLSSYYLGASVLVLALGAVCGVRGQRTWLLAGLVVFSLVMALGNQTVFYEWFKKFVPVVGLARYPVKFVALAAFVVPLLAAGAVQRLREAPQSGKLWCGLIATAVALLAVLAALLWGARAHPLPFDQWDVTFWNACWRVGFMVLVLVLLRLAVWPGAASPWVPRLAGLGMMAVIAIDAATHSPKQNPTLPASVLQPGLWEQAFKKKPPQFGESRLMISPQAEPYLLNSRVREPADNFFGKRLAEWSNLNVLDGIPKVNGSSTLQLREQRQVESMLYAMTNGLPAGLLDFLGVAELTAPGQIVEWAARTNFLPLVTAGQRPVFVEGTNSLAALAAAEFNPREVVLLPKDAETEVTAKEKTRAVILSTNIAAQRLEFEVEAEGPAMVVIAQSFYHPWEAEVDGQSARLWRANHAFQALEVPAGRHHVVVAYRDRNFTAGVAVSLATLLGCGLFWMRQRRLAVTQ